MAAVVEPEVAGGLGEGTLMDRSVHPPRVSRLVYELEGWLGDDIVETFPCFLVTERLARALAKAGLTGFSLTDVTVRVGEQLAERLDGARPVFLWLKVNGSEGSDDLWLDADQRLVVSERALGVLGAHRVGHAVVTPLMPHAAVPEDALSLR